MTKKKFCCDASQHMYDTYYTQQSGQGVPVFIGYKGQKGHGLGSVLGGLFRSAVPMLKKGLSSLGKQALRTGLNIASDVAEGETIRGAVGKHVPIVNMSKGDIGRQALKTGLRLANDVVGEPAVKKRKTKTIKRTAKKRKLTKQSGNGKVKTKRRKKKKKDIFD